MQQMIVSHGVFDTELPLLVKCLRTIPSCCVSGISSTSPPFCFCAQFAGAQADAADQLGVNSLSAARSALSSKFASSVGALGIPNSELQMLQDASGLGNLGLGQFEGRSSVEQMLKFTPSLNQQQLQQQLAASEQGLSSLQRHLDISKLMGGGGGASGLLGQSGSLLSASAVSAQRQAALASRLRANQQQADDQTKDSRNAEL